MTVFNQDLTQQQLNFVPRFTPVNLTLNLTVTNRYNSTSFSSELAYTFVDGILNIEVDFTGTNITLTDNGKYQVTVLDGVNVIYRGKAISTNQSTQDYKITKQVYTYE